jgi:hypothetical protein
MPLSNRGVKKTALAKALAVFSCRPCETCEAD